MVDWNQASTIATAVGTIALAIFAGFTFKGLKDQMKLLYDQANAMKRQADIMEEQSKLMLADIEYDRLVKRYQRLREEMDKLVMPLYNRHDHDLTFRRHLSDRTSIDPKEHDYASFWDAIRQNAYLTQSPDLRLALSNYFQTLESLFSRTNEEWREKGATFEKIYDGSKKELIKNVEIRCRELEKEIIEVEKALKINEGNRH